MSYILSNSDWQNLNQTLYRINTEEDRETFLFHVMKHLNLLCPYSCGVFNLTRATAAGPKIYESSGVNLLPEDLENINRFGLANSSFLHGICALPGGCTFSGLSRDQFTAVQQMYFRSTVLPKNPDNTLATVLYHGSDLLGYILLMRTDAEAPFSGSDVCAMDTIRHHIALQLYKVLRASENKDQELTEKLSLEKTLSRYDLTRREIELLHRMLDHQTDAQICQTLFIAQSTFKKHLNHIYQKTNVKSRVELMQLINSQQQRS